MPDQPETVTAQPVRENRVARERRTAVLEAAGRIFLGKGYEATSMADIITAAGGSKASIYRQFHNKEGLFAAVVADTIARLSDQLFDLPADTSDVAGKLETIGVQFVTLLVDDTARALRRVSLHAAEQFPDIGRTFFDSGPRIVLTKLTEFIRRAHDHGDLNAPDAGLAAWQFVMLCQAQYVYPCIVAGTALPAQDQLRLVVTEAVATFLGRFGVKVMQPLSRPV